MTLKILVGEGEDERRSFPRIPHIQFVCIDRSAPYGMHPFPILRLRD